MSESLTNKLAWRVSQFHSEYSQDIIDGINSILNTLRGPTSNCSQTLAVYANSDYSGALILPRGMREMPDESTLGFGWNIYTATGKSGNNTEPYIQLSEFINANLTDAQICYGRAIGGKIVHGRDNFDIEISFFYKNLESLESNSSDNAKLNTEGKILPYNQLASKNSVWKLHYFAEKDIGSVEYSLSTSLDGMYGVIENCMHILAATYSVGYNVYRHFSYGGVLTPDNLYAPPDISNLTNVWSFFYSLGEYHDVFNNFTRFLSNLTDAQVCNGKMISTGIPGNDRAYPNKYATIGFAYMDLIGDSHAHDYSSHIGDIAEP